MTTETTLSISAPQARSVTVIAQWTKQSSLPMSRDAKGLWSITTPVPPGIWEYRLSIDGVELVDPSNGLVKAQREPRSSLLHVPSHPPSPWDEQTIPHGVLHAHSFFSRLLNVHRNVIVYTPPGYSDASAPLPVLYLLHGYSDNERAWTTNGKAHWIADALIAQKQCGPMLIVMSDAHALPPTDLSDRDKYFRDNTSAALREFNDDVRPLVESTYRVKSDAASRAFAGLSMGGGIALTAALTQPVDFSSIAAFSPAPPSLQAMPTDPSLPGLINEKLKLLWIPIGRDDFLIPRIGPVVELMKRVGINVEYDVTNGDHSWWLWREYLVKLLPRLFQ